MSEHKTHFGFQDVDPEDKQPKVNKVFSDVAQKYDIMNDLMSLGIHRLWKRHAIAKLELQATDTMLDLAGGSGDLLSLAYPKLNAKGRLILCDINHQMLQVGQDRLTDKGMVHFETLEANAEHLPLASNSVDKITMAFGLRNVTNKDSALKEMARVLKPGGKCLILEFSKPSKALEKFYDFYSFKILPKIGELVANDRASYEYLVESIRMHPDQETLRTMMSEAGFDEAYFENLSTGIVALHTGLKF